MFVTLDGKSFESILVHMARPGRPVEMVPALRMGAGHPLHEPRHLAIFIRPDHEVPVIWHNAIGQNAYRLEIFRVLNDLQERVVINVRSKQSIASHATIQHVEDDITVGAATRRDMSQDLPVQTGLSDYYIYVYYHRGRPSAAGGSCRHTED